MAPVLGKDVRGIGFTRDVEETKDTGSNGLDTKISLKAVYVLRRTYAQISLAGHP